MLQPESPFYLAVNYFKTEAQSKSEGSRWFKSQPMGVNKLKQLDERNERNSGNLCENKSQRKKNASSKTPRLNNDLPPLRERQMENISRILSSSSPTTNAVLPTQPSLQCNFTQAHSSTSALNNNKLHQFHRKWTITTL